MRIVLITRKLCCAGGLLFATLLSAGCAVLDSHQIIARAIVPREAPTPLPEPTRSEIVEEVWSTIDKRYVDKNFNGKDWKKILSDYVDKWKTASSDTQFWNLLDKMVGELGDSHTRVESPETVSNRQRRERLSYGLNLIQLEGRFVVSAVSSNSDAWYAGVRIGMLVEQINNIPAAQKYAEIDVQARLQSTPQIRNRQLLNRLLEVDIDEKSKATLNLLVKREDDSQMRVIVKPSVLQTRASLIQRVLPSGFGYIRFSAFDESLRTQLLQAIASLQDTPAMIIDLRGNGGGSGAMAIALIERFMSEAKPIGRAYSRDNAPIRLLGFSLFNFTEQPKPAGKDAYRKPLVVLTDVGTASASELTTAGLRELGNTTVIGQTSCGCLLGFLGYHALPGGAQLAYSEIGFVSASGRIVEREGITPDIEVPITLSTLRSHRDFGLEAAVKTLQEKTKQTASR